MADDESLTVSDICKALGIGRTTFYRYVKAKQGWLRIEFASEMPECLREVFEPVVADEVDLCLRTAGVKRSIKPFVKPRCQLAKPIERERKHIKDNVSPFTVSLHPCRSVLIGVHVCSRVLETKARQQSSRSVIVSADGREDLLNPLAFLQ
jgi:AcrR family transcriptional regulator